MADKIANFHAMRVYDVLLVFERHNSIETPIYQALRV